MLANVVNVDIGEGGCDDRRMPLKRFHQSLRRRLLCHFNYSNYCYHFKVLMVTEFCT